MRSIPTASLTLLVLTLTVLVGCPFLFDGAGDGNGDNTGPTTIAGTWTGTLARTTNLAINGQQGNPRPGETELTITFDGEYLPTTLPVWGFNLAFDQATTQHAVGETETLNFDANFPYRQVTLVVTITEATYGESSARVVMALDYAGANDDLGLVQEGTGTMTIEAAIEGDDLDFSGVAQYTVTETNTAIDVTVQTIETINCTGTLTAE